MTEGKLVLHEMFRWLETHEFTGDGDDIMDAAQSSYNAFNAGADPRWTVGYPRVAGMLFSMTGVTAHGTTRNPKGKA